MEVITGLWSREKRATPGILQVKHPVDRLLVGLFYKHFLVVYDVDATGEAISCIHDINVIANHTTWNVIHISFAGIVYDI